MKTGLKITKLAQDLIDSEMINTFSHFENELIRNVSICTNKGIWGKAYFGFHSNSDEKRLIGYIKKVAVKVWNRNHTVRSTKDIN